MAEPATRPMSEIERKAVELEAASQVNQKLRDQPASAASTRASQEKALREVITGMPEDSRHLMHTGKADGIARLVRKHADELERENLIRKMTRWEMDAVYVKANKNVDAALNGETVSEAERNARVRKEHDKITGVPNQGDYSKNDKYVAMKNENSVVDITTEYLKDLPYEAPSPREKLSAVTNPAFDQLLKAHNVQVHQTVRQTHPQEEELAPALRLRLAEGPQPVFRKLDTIEQSAVYAESEERVKKKYGSEKLTQGQSAMYLAIEREEITGVPNIPGAPLLIRADDEHERVIREITKKFEANERAKSPVRLNESSERGNPEPDPFELKPLQIAKASKINMLG